MRAHSFFGGLTMADSKGIPKKRKRSAISLSHSLGIITRSKSQIHIHRNRSGKHRTLSIGVGKHQDLQPFLKRPRKSSPAEDSVGCDLPSVSIKDLRLRRVFSPSSTDGVIPNCLDDEENLGKSEISGNCLEGRKEDCGNGDFRKLEISNEEIVQSTPPDAEIVGVEQVVERNEGENMKKERGFPEERNDMNYSTKSVLRPCSRVKIFKPPGSFSLRRLLPYLMDIKKDCSGSPLIGLCPKTENGFEEKRLLDSNVNESSGVKSMASGCFLEDHISDSAKELNMGSVESFSMPLVNGEVKKFKLQVSTEDLNPNCLKNYSSSTIEDSHFSKENSAGVFSNDQILEDDGEVAKTKVKSCDYNEVTINAEEIKQSEIEDNNAGVIGKVEDLNVPCMSVTPPETDMVCKMETDDSRVSRVDCLPLGTNHGGEKSKNETAHRNHSQESDKSLDSSPKDKLVPNQQLRLRLSKIPGSFSYRRLLPFLIDLTNDYSGASGNDQSLKVEKSSKEKPLSIGFTSAKGACIETFECKSRAVEQYTGDGIQVPVTEATAIGCSSNDKLTRSPKEVAGSSLIPASKQEHALVIKHAALDANQKLETRPKHVVEPPAMSSSPFINSGLLRREEVAKSVSCRLTFETKADTMKSTAKCANHVKQIEADSLGEASTPIGFPIVCLKKGILKRNPPGCRGNCSCLNCSSFRLHAERAFEFSRNQMQDAEEVALDLIRELSFLRNVLEKSAFGAKDQSSIYINEVEDACKRASEAEELAKARLSEMNYDLNIHCRVPCVQRPSVRFANYVEEQIIPIADSSNK